uniref:Uncharacterized protein n=1 Tax=Brassica campestris TaxID=3711 RepID=A0A3P6B3L1_BRACM|nr:unnamed protein product [Brassica rapa]
MCDPPCEGLKRKCPSTGGGVSSRTRARKAVSNGNEPVREESNPVSGTTVVSLSLDTESEGIVLVPTVNDETLLARIIDPEPEYHCVEERIVKAMEEGFSGINLTVETKLEAMNLRMGKLEKNHKGNDDEEYR